MNENLKIHTYIFAVTQERGDQKTTLTAGVSVITQKLVICSIVSFTFKECSIMDDRITCLPSFIFEKCFVKSMKNFESSLKDIFKCLNQSLPFKSLILGFPSM